MADLEILADDGQLYVDSRLIAERLGIEHRSFLQTVGDYQTQIEQAFGILRFENAKIDGRGRPARFVFLTEDQATFVMTLSRNSPEVVQCKLDLVRSFSRAKELLQSGIQSPQPNAVPYWYQRLRIALSDEEKPLLTGYFCIYKEILDLFAELENRLGYIIPDQNPDTGQYLIPDISIAQGFNKFLRSEDEYACEARLNFLGSSEIVDFRRPGRRKSGWFEGGKDYYKVKPYNHVYPSESHGRYQVQEANSYPNEYLSIMRHYVQEYWIPDKCIPYLQKRDTTGLRLLRERVRELPTTTRKNLAQTLVGKLLYSLPESS